MMNRSEAIAQLREWIKPGQRLYTVLRHVSRSGMQRTIGMVLIDADGTLRHPNYAVSVALGYPLDKNRDGVRVNGCGMDMGFEVVYNLGRALFPDGYGVESSGIGAPVRPESKLHAAQLAHAGYTFRGRNGDASGWDNDGGYALKHEWI